MVYSNFLICFTLFLNSLVSGQRYRAIEKPGGKITCSGKNLQPTPEFLSYILSRLRKCGVSISQISVSIADQNALIKSLTDKCQIRCIAKELKVFNPRGQKFNQDSGKKLAHFFDSTIRKKFETKFSTCFKTQGGKINFKEIQPGNCSSWNPLIKCVITAFKKGCM